MNKYEFYPYSKIPFDELKKFDVSRIARGETKKEGFLEVYKRYGINLPDFWINKRNSFIARTLPAYKANPTYRRYLSLLAWGFKPEIKHKPII